MNCSLRLSHLMLALFTQTDKKLIPTLPRYTFTGRIVVVQSESEAECAVRYLRTCPLLGIDTETRPSFRRGITHQVALLQVAGGNLCFLFRLNFMGFPDCLVQLLEDEKLCKVGLSLKDDFLQLRHRCPGFTPRNCIDLQQIATAMGIEDMSLAKLFANFFRQRISKTAQLTNWEADVLDEKQRIYAATDADACIQLYQRMTQLQASKDFTLLPPPPKPQETTEATATSVRCIVKKGNNPRKTAAKRKSKTSAAKTKLSKTATVKRKTTTRKRITSRIQSQQSKDVSSL